MLAAGYDWWLPVDASAHGGDIDRLIVLVHWFMAVLFVGWGIYFVYCLVHFRSRPGHQPSTQLPKAKASKYSEVVVVVIEAVLLLGFSIPIWAQVRGPGHARELHDPLVVRVVAQQFAWNIHYPGKDGIFGRLDLTTISPDNPMGLDRSDPVAKDDIVTINQLHVPVNRDVLVHLTSMDVIHSFGLTVLRVKQDVIPGISIPIWFKATKTTDEVRQMMVNTYPTRPQVMPILKNHVAVADTPANGTVIVRKGEPITADTVAALAAAGIQEIQAAPAVPAEIACAQLCGLGHYRMRGYLHIDTKAQYAQWLAEEEEWLSAYEDDEAY